jgi:hypothetical protein
MRLLLASVAALAAITLAAPSFAQETAPAPTPTPSVKPKPGTTAYCNTLKSSTSKSSCLKRVHAQAATPKAPTASTTHKSKAKKLDAPKGDSSAQLTPPASAPAAAPPSQTINVPPLPQKTI